MYRLPLALARGAAVVVVMALVTGVGPARAQAPPPLVGRWRGSGVDLHVQPDGSYVWAAPPHNLRGQLLSQGNQIRFVAPGFFVDYQVSLIGDQLRLLGVDGGVVALQRVGSVGGHGAAPSAAPAHAPAPATGQPGRADKLAFLQLLQAYPSMDPGQLVQHFVALHPAFQQQLQIYDRLQLDMVQRMCTHPAGQGAVWRSASGQTQGCAAVMAEKQQALLLGQQMGMDTEQGFRSMVAQERTTLSMGLRCGMGLEDRGVCSTYLGTQRAMGQARHETNTLMLDNLRATPQWEVKPTPGQP